MSEPSEHPQAIRSADRRADPDYAERNKEYQKRYREKNKKSRAEYNRQLIAKMTPEQKAEYRARINARRKERGEEYKEMRREYYGRRTEIWILANIRKRAKEQGVPCTITTKDIMPPEFCPILGLKLERNKKGREEGPQDNSPSVDRIVPALGYVPGNIIVISQLANRIKTNATLEQLRKVADFYEQLARNMDAVSECLSLSKSQHLSREPV